jgi:hypothetical protein
MPGGINITSLSKLFAIAMIGTSLCAVKVSHIKVIFPGGPTIGAILSNALQSYCRITKFFLMSKDKIAVRDLIGKIGSEGLISIDTML